MKRALHLIVVGFLLAGALVVSDHQGVPQRLPGVALGWPLLLHIERALALLGLLGVGVLVGSRALNGEFPVRLGQIEYSAQSMDALEAIDRRLGLVEAAFVADAPEVTDRGGAQ